MAETFWQAWWVERRRRLSPHAKLRAIFASREPTTVPPYLLNKDGELPCGCAELCRVCGPAVADVLASAPIQEGEQG
jgi:hypothetical protein